MNVGHWRTAQPYSKDGRWADGEPLTGRYISLTLANLAFIPLLQHFVFAVSPGVPSTFFQQQDVRKCDRGESGARRQTDQDSFLVQPET